MNYNMIKDLTNFLLPEYKDKTEKRKVAGWLFLAGILYTLVLTLVKLSNGVVDNLPTLVTLLYLMFWIFFGPTVDLWSPLKHFFLKLSLKKKVNSLTTAMECWGDATLLVLLEEYIEAKNLPEEVQQWVRGNTWILDYCDENIGSFYQLLEREARRILEERGYIETFRDFICPVRLKRDRMIPPKH